MRRHGVQAGSWLKQNSFRPVNNLGSARGTPQPLPSAPPQLSALEVEAIGLWDGRVMQPTRVGEVNRRTAQDDHVWRSAHQDEEMLRARLMNLQLHDAAKSESQRRGQKQDKREQREQHVHQEEHSKLLLPSCPPAAERPPTAPTVTTLQSLGLRHGSRVEVSLAGTHGELAWRRATVHLEGAADSGGERVDTMCFLVYDDRQTAGASEERMTSFCVRPGACLDLETSTVQTMSWRHCEDVCEDAKEPPPTTCDRLVPSSCDEQEQAGSRAATLPLEPSFDRPSTTHERERRKSYELKRLMAELAQMAAKAERAEAKLAEGEETHKAKAFAEQEARSRTVAAAQPDTPSEFICPITQEVMLDPVSTVDGHTYERGAIKRWLSRKRTSPLTGAPLKSTALVPNIALRKLIEEHQQGVTA